MIMSVILTVILNIRSQGTKQGLRSWFEVSYAIES